MHSSICWLQIRSFIDLCVEDPIVREGTAEDREQQVTYVDSLVLLGKFGQIVDTGSARSG